MTETNQNKTASDYGIKYIFDVEWFDYESSMYKYFWLGFFPADNALDLYDKKLKKTFLHRCTVPGVTISQLYIGNTINILGRLFRITSYATDFTKQRMFTFRQKTCGLLKPGTDAQIGDVIKCITNCGLQVTKIRMCQLKQSESLEFYRDLKSQTYITALMTIMTSAPIIAFEIVGENAIEKWKEVIGPRDPAEARQIAPQSLRASYGYDLSNNGFHGSCNFDDVQRELDFFFPEDLRKAPNTTAKYGNCTLCIIKPHVLMDGTLGDILQDITTEGFLITAMFSIHLSLVNADEFMEIYRGVLENYADVILHLCSGQCIALEISHPTLNSFEEFRKFCGPIDPAIARKIRPNTLRARYGLNYDYNAVYCTDLEEDRQSDVEYFFRILNS